ncbi:MAG: cytochrome c maturation protein CcmE [Fimbriimonadaceae bacterium]|nr:cytochrome c maturation protein CcmE [Fimbriimonadaceae bacterium]MBX3334578.1 cytochrome c maturation protein CcmE [Nitrospira sp.]
MAKQKNLTAIVVVLVSVLALSGVVFAFLMQSSPYVTVAEAKTMSGDNLHLAGVIVPGSIQTTASGSAKVSFMLQDDKGDLLPVVYKRPAPPNLRTADRVVAIGGFQDGAFEARDLLLKCPSKYESESGGESAQK